MYKQYLKETQFIETIEEYYGFITYQIVGTACIIHDIYILPEFRGNKGLAEGLADEVVEKAIGCSILGAEVYKGNPAWKANLRRFKRYGFVVETEDNYEVILNKYLGALVC